MHETIRIAAAQISPVWLDRAATLTKVQARAEEAAAAGCDLVAFGEALVPGYPFWLEPTGGARFDATDQKELYALYMDQAVQPEAGHLDELCRIARSAKMSIVLGTVERAADRGGHSLYCSCAYIEPDGEIGSIQRKLMPTHDERLVWAIGDGAGLVTHPLGPFTVGALNCWENWMPMARAALYGQGEDLHVAIWPGSPRNTEEITRFIARESRSYVLSVSGVFKPEQIPAGVPYRAEMLQAAKGDLAEGGSCIAGPDGSWLLAPLGNDEGLFHVEIDHRRVREERQNFDPSGHYSRPDVLRLTVFRERQRPVRLVDD